MIRALVQVQANFPFPSLIDIEHLGRRKEVQDKFRKVCAQETG